MSTKRMLQLGEQIRDHIANMLVRGEIHDPRVKDVTIHSVKMTSDLQTAKVYFTCSDKNKILEAHKEDGNPIIAVEPINSKNKNVKNLPITARKKKALVSDIVQDTEKGLRQAAGYIRRELGKQLQIRYIPQILFFYDDSLEYSLKMVSVLSKVRAELREDEKKRSEEENQNSEN